jgi:sugar diacid utilization regulator
MSHPTVVVDAYVQELSAELLRRLDALAAELAATSLNLSQQGAFVVVAAETSRVGDQSLLRLEETLRRHDVISAWRFDAEQQTGIVCLSSQFTVDILCQQIARFAPGRAGVSRVYDSLATTPDALREARVACSSAGFQARAVVRYDKEPVAVLLASSPEASAVLANSTLGPVLALHRADRALLLDTLRSWLAGHGSASTAAAQLHVHRNTVRYRLRRIQTLTESDLTDPIAVGRLHLALESTRIFGVDQVASAGAQTVEPSTLG